MKLGFIIPTYPGEKRVALLPRDIDNFNNEIFIENGFAANLDIADHEYVDKGCIVASRQTIFEVCDTIFSLKLIQPADCDLLREGQMIIGWTHPTGSGREFFQQVALKKKLKIVDLDNIYPTLYYGDMKKSLSFIPKNFIWRNSFYAGIASVQHALMVCGIFPDALTKVAILACGNVSQGAYNIVSRYGADVRMFYRKTLGEFYDSIADYDIIINGIETDSSVSHIITKQQLQVVKKGCLIIDAAADAGNAIEGTHYTSIDNPVYKENGLYFYEVNNAPTIFYRTASIEISRAFSKWIYREDVKRFWDIVDNML